MVSLSGIAKKSGVSKAAIFKHYKDKAAIFDEMKARFLDDICEVLRTRAAYSRESVRRTVDGKNFLELSNYDLFYSIAYFFAKHPEYFGMIKRFCSMPHLLHQTLDIELGKRGVHHVPFEHPADGGGWRDSNGGECCRNEQDFMRGTEGLYSFTTLLYFSMQYCSEEKGGDSIGATQFAENISRFLVTGWAELRPLAGEEKETLRNRCFVNPRELPETNRFFHALIAVTFKYGFTGITVERIAEEVGMAKSSIYAFYQNKDDLIQKLVQQEIGYFLDCISEKLDGLTDTAHIVYVFLHVVYAYFAVRKEIIAVMVMHFSQMGKRKMLYGTIDEAKISKALLKLNALTVPELGIKLDRFSRVEWLASLPASFLISMHRIGAMNGTVPMPGGSGNEIVARLYEILGSSQSSKMSGCLLENVEEEIGFVSPQAGREHGS
ncbi:MAG: hypothetical protein Ta2A_16610 [Treponemataceae bacterium]|nr:MAG: hypothetical protein Ta2A_16610 [Treponemataceae bacterium]